MTVERDRSSHPCCFAFGKPNALAELKAIGVEEEVPGTAR